MTRYSVWKFPLSLAGSIQMPKGARILMVDVQFESPMVWALVDVDAPVVNRALRVYGTGWDLPSGDPGKFVGSYMLGGGAYVFHVFDEGEVVVQ